VEVGAILCYFVAAGLFVRGKRRDYPVVSGQQRIWIEHC